jgi:hypothetical protein
MSSSDLDFLVSALSHHGITREEVQDLITSFEDVSKSQKDLNKMIKTDKYVLLQAIATKYVEVKTKLDELVGGKSDLFIKKQNSFVEKRAAFISKVKAHPLGESKVLEAFPIFKGVIG